MENDAKQEDSIRNLMETFGRWFLCANFSYLSSRKDLKSHQKMNERIPNMTPSLKPFFDTFIPMLITFLGISSSSFQGVTPISNDALKSLQGNHDSPFVGKPHG